MLAVQRTPQREADPYKASPNGRDTAPTVADFGDVEAADEIDEDYELRRRFFLLRSKFPMVFTPFIKELKKLGPYAYDILLNMNTYMQTLPRGFREYDVAPDDPQDIYLLTDLCLYSPRESDGEGGIFISQGHHGRIIPNESNTFCVQWRYNYNGWTFLGRVLEHAASVSPTDVIVQEIISLISTTLKSLDNTAALDLLEYVCANLPADEDVISIIGTVLGDALQRKNVSVSVAAIEFFTSLIPILPHRVWDYLGTSNLLDRNGHGGMAAFILSSVEIISGDYSFTLATIQMVNMLVRDTVISKLSTAMRPEIRTHVLLQFVRHFANIFESFPYWKYEDLMQRLDIAISICDLFVGILTAVYGIDEASIEGDKINGTLFPASQHIVDRFLTVDGKNLRCLQPILNSIEASARSIEALTSDEDLLNRNYEWVEAALIFSEKLLRVRTLIKRQPSQLERKLFGLAPSLTDLFIRENVLRFRIVKLLASMVDSTWENEEPPSLLAHLGPGSSLAFASALNKAIGSKLDLDAQNEIAKFAATVFSSKQQGLSILLLTGKELGNINSSKTDKEVEPTTSLVQVLEEKAASFEDLPVQLSINILECIALAQNARATAVFDSKKNTDLMHKIFSMLDLGSGGKVTGLESTDTIVRFCHNALLASRAVQLCAVQLHKSQRKSDESKAIIEYFLKSDNLLKLSDNALRIQGYRASLHGNLHRNFDKKWPMAKLIRFQRTKLSEKIYGQSYMFDLEMMDDMFSAEPMWAGYRNEIVQANLNLSLIDSQSHLFRAWWLLIAALLEHLRSHNALLKLLETIAVKCLQTNIDEGIMAPLFLPIVNDRSKLAFAIVLKLSENASSSNAGADFKNLLSLAWAWTSSVDVDFPRALTDGEHETYRPLLRTLLICVRALKGKKADDKVRDIACNIVEHIVSKAFTILGPEALKAFHRGAEAGPVVLGQSSQDMLLVTSLLRDCLQIEGVPS